MIPLNDGRPLLDYLLSPLADAGFTEACLVIGPEHDVVRDRYRSAVLVRRLRIVTAIQAEPRGTADAVLSAREFAADGEFVVLNGDNYYSAATLDKLRRQHAPALPAFARETLVRDGQIPAERIAQYALLDIAPDGALRRIVEKPDDATARALSGAPVSMNCWLFTPAIFEACRHVEPSARGELELPLAVQYAIDTMGMRFITFRAEEPVLDLSRREDILVVAARLADVEVRL